MKRIFITGSIVAVGGSNVAGIDVCFGSLAGVEHPPSKTKMIISVASFR
jgi:hypothetical protein